MNLGLATNAVWSAPALAVALGALAAVVAVSLKLRFLPVLRAEPDSYGELTAQLDGALNTLREIEERAEHAPSPELLREKGELENRAAKLYATLRELGAQRAHAAKARANDNEGASKPRLSGLSPQLTGALWGAASTALIAFLLFTVQRESKVEPLLAAQAPSAAPGPSLDGDALASLKRRLEQNPDDVPALLAMAHQLLRAQMLDEARTVNERALRLAPMDLEALTHAAVLTASTGDTPGAMAGLGMVLRKDPQFAEAWFFRGMLSMQTGDLTTMRESLTEFVRLAPEGPQKERARAMLERAQSATP